MQKVFTVDIPDEIYIDSWENGRTASFTYDGPETVYAVISSESQTLGETSLEPFPDDSVYIIDAEKYNVLEISAETDTALAYYILESMDNTPYQYEYIDVENHDGSIFAEPTNYRLKDYFEIIYDIDLETPILKIIPTYMSTESWELEQLPIVRDKLEILIYNRDNVDHTESNSALIASSILALEEYKSTIASARSWKYETIDMTEIPAVSKSLEKMLTPVPIVVPDPIEYPPAVAEEEEV